MSGKINTSGHMFRKSIVKDTSGNIINLLDEATGGYIIRNRQVVDPKRYAEILQKEKDRREAAQAHLHAIDNPNAGNRNLKGSEAIKEMTKVSELEKKVEGMESKLDQILKALNK